MIPSPLGLVIVMKEKIEPCQGLGTGIGMCIPKTPRHGDAVSPPSRPRLDRSASGRL